MSILLAYDITHLCLSSPLKSWFYLFLFYLFILYWVLDKKYCHGHIFEATRMIMMNMLNIEMFCDDFEHGKATWVALVQPVVPPRL